MQCILWRCERNRRQQGALTDRNVQVRQPLRSLQPLLLTGGTCLVTFTCSHHHRHFPSLSAPLSSPSTGSAGVALQLQQGSPTASSAVELSLIVIREHCCYIAHPRMHTDCHPGLRCACAADATHHALRHLITQVHAMLEDVGRAAARAADEEESYTSRCMRAAFTPQRVSEVRGYSLAQVVQQLQSLTMKLALLLQHDNGAACGARSGSGSMGGSNMQQQQEEDEELPPALSFGIDGVVDEYTELAMLLHVASDKVNLQLGEC